MRLVPTPRPSVDAVKAGPWTPVEDISEQPRFRMFADHRGRAEYGLAASATFNDTKVLAFQMSFRATGSRYSGHPDAFRLDHSGNPAARASWTTSFRLRSCVLVELHDPVPSLLISNRAIYDLEPTFFDGLRRVRSTPRRFRRVFRGAPTTVTSRVRY